MSREALYRALVFLVPLALFFAQPVHMVDFAIWIAQGREILAGHALSQDAFSVLPTRPMVYPSWGVAALYAALERLGGLSCVVVAGRLALVPLLGETYRLSIFRSERPWTRRNLALILVSWLGAIPLWSDRPGFIALIPLVIGYGIVSKEERLRGADYAALGLLEAVWANLHGSFVILPLLLIWRAAWGPRRAIPRALLGCAAVAACALLNPFGYRVFPFVLETIRFSKERIEEWQMTSWKVLFPSGLLYCALLAVLAAGLVRGKIRARSPFIVVAMLGMVARRFAPLPFLLLLPFLAEQGLLSQEPARGGLFHGPSAVKKAVNLSLAASWLLIAIFLTPALKAKLAWVLPKSKRAVYDSSAPFAIAAAIRASPDHGPVLSAWDYAGFLALQGNRIFLDERNVIYSDNDYARTVSALGAAPGWRGFVARYGTRFLVLDETANAALIREAEASGVFHRVMAENGVVLYSR